MDLPVNFVEWAEQSLIPHAYRMAAHNRDCLFAGV
jgi:hypothetical protein